MVPPQQHPEISIVIPTLGRRDKLEQVLARLDEQTVDAARFEVIVVEDAAESDSADLPAQLGAKSYDLHTLRGRQPGASSARNVGARKASTDLVLFLDDDVLPKPELVAEHLAWHEREADDRVGVLGWVEWSPAIKVTPFMRWLESGIQFDFDAIEGIEAGWGRFYTANVSIKRSIFEAVGGFDAENLPFGYEDLDLALRMSERGFRLLLNRSAGAEHVHEMTLDMWKRRVRRIARSERRFIELHPEQKPYFFDLFSDAEAAPTARGRWLSVASLIPESTPWLGARVRGSLDAYFRQVLSGPFLDEWRSLT